MKRFKSEIELRACITKGFFDLDFEFHKKYGSICPLKENLIALAYDGDTYDCKSVDEAMTVKFFDGKSLNQIAAELDF